MTSPARDVLLVEDNPVDTDLVLKAFRQQPMAVRMHHVCDGIECLDFLGRIGIYAKSPRPEIILLAFNLPRMDGREVLKQLKRRPDLAEIPVVGLASSGDATEVVEAYRHHLNAYVVKPADAQRFCDVIGSTIHFWLEVAALPGG